MRRRAVRRCALVGARAAPAASADARPLRPECSQRSRRQLGQRPQHEGALVQARVRHGQRRACRCARRRSSSRSRSSVRGALRYGPLAAVRALDAPAARRAAPCGASPVSQLGHRVQVVGPAGVDRCGAVERRARAQPRVAAARRSARSAASQRRRARRRGWRRGRCRRAHAAAAGALTPSAASPPRPARRRARAPPAAPLRRRRRRLRRRRVAVGRALAAVASPRRRLAGVARPPRRAARARAARAAAPASRASSISARALLVAAEREVLPPVGQLRVDLAGVGAQAQEVEAGAKARLLDQRERRCCRCAARSAAASSRSRACRRPACRGRRCRRCARRTPRRSPPAAPGTACSPAALSVLPAVAHVVPQHAGQQEARRHRLALADAAVGVGQRELHEAARAVAALARRAPRRAAGRCRGARPSACAAARCWPAHGRSAAA